MDENDWLRESLPDVLRQFGFAAQAFPSAEACPASQHVTETRCLTLDVAMPGVSGVCLFLTRVQPHGHAHGIHSRILPAKTRVRPVPICQGQPVRETQCTRSMKLACVPVRGTAAEATIAPASIDR